MRSAVDRRIEKLASEVTFGPAPKSGRYRIWGKIGWCFVDTPLGRVRIHYNDGSYTCCNFKTFARWNPELIEQ